MKECRSGYSKISQGKHLYTVPSQGTHLRIVLGSDTTFRILSLKTSKKKKKVGDDLSQIENLRTIDVFAQPAQCADGRRIHSPLR